MIRLMDTLSYLGFHQRGCVRPSFPDVEGRVSSSIEGASTEERIGAYLTGRPITLAPEWKASSDASSPEEIALNVDEISDLRQLGRTDFPLTRRNLWPVLEYKCFSESETFPVGPEIPKY